MAFPKIEACLICEDARPEPGNKLNILGFFGLPPRVDIHVGEMGTPIKLLFLFVTGATTGGAYRPRQTIERPDGTVLFQHESAAITFERGAQASFIGLGFILPFDQEGRHVLKLSVDGREIGSYEFGIKFGFPPSLSPSPSPSPSPGA